MKSHHQLTFVPNRQRAGELRAFRDLLETYFDRSQRDPDDVPFDWPGAQAARARINQMLPRVLEVVRAAGIGGPVGIGTATDPGVTLGRVDVLNRIFSATYAEGADQEIFDLLDMAIGVYDSGRFGALLRTANPFHYVGMALSVVARGPRWLLSSLGFRRGPAAPRLRADDLARLELVAARLSDVEDLIETRLAAYQDRQALRQVESNRQLAELAERLDFAERVLARREPVERLEAPERPDVATPV